MSKKGGILWVLACVVVGLLLAFGSFFLGRWSVYRSSEVGKIASIMQLIERDYVDSVSMDSIQEAAIPLLLAQLDPHSQYLPASINQSETERLEGSFSGIGIQFNRLLDTVVVVNVVPGSPSSRVDIRPGDRILRANGKSLLGAKISDDSIKGLLKGPKGSVASLDMLRDRKPTNAKVVRGDVPVRSLDAAYPLRDGILYIRLNGWGRTTHSELLSAVAAYSTKTKKIRGMVMDLRGNVGGYLDAAVIVSNEFLKEGQKIVYTEGRAYPREASSADGNGILKDLPLSVLVDENSASSSEIFAGAMQDHDRALIVGRRTFGKGLVQRPFELSDGSVVRLTVARYYTPSGRSIQKPYVHGDEYDYRMDLQERFVHGELYSQDSIRVDRKEAYKTDGGRTVYGGGGIIPDIFVPMDTLKVNAYYQRLAQRGIIPQYAFLYADRNRARLSALSTVPALVAYLDKQALIYKVADYAARNGIPMRPGMMYDCSDLILNQLYAFVADYVFGREAFFEILNSSDPMLKIATERLETGGWSPLDYGQKDIASRIVLPESISYSRLAKLALGLCGRGYHFGSVF